MRELLGSPKIDDSERQKLFKKMFGYYNDGLFKMMTNKFKKLFGEDVDFVFKPTKFKRMKKKFKDGKGTEILHDLDEDITIDLDVGDTVVMGKFKNKKVVVKDISWNEKGDMLINGKMATKWRMFKKKPNIPDSQFDEYIMIE